MVLSRRNRRAVPEKLLGCANALSSFRIFLFVEAKQMAHMLVAFKVQVVVHLQRKGMGRMIDLEIGGRPPVAG